MFLTKCCCEPYCAHLTRCWVFSGFASLSSLFPVRLKVAQQLTLISGVRGVMSICMPHCTLLRSGKWPSWSYMEIVATKDLTSKSLFWEKSGMNKAWIILGENSIKVQRKKRRWRQCEVVRFLVNSMQWQSCHCVYLLPNTATWIAIEKSPAYFDNILIFNL